MYFLSEALPGVWPLGVLILARTALPPKPGLNHSVLLLLLFFLHNQSIKLLFCSPSISLLAVAGISVSQSAPRRRPSPPASAPSPSPSSRS